MPLPPSLVAKLAKRGLLKATEPIEEVIAEDYDDNLNKQQEEELEPLDPEPQYLLHETTACPNQTNPFHECTTYCEDRWGFQKFDPDPDMLLKKDVMLGKYPIPQGWMEVADPNTNRFYYWNSLTDEVSWLPPDHPKAKVGLSAQRLRELMASSSKMADTLRDSDGEMTSDEDSDDSDDDDDDDDKKNDLSDSEDEQLNKKKFNNRKEITRKRAHDNLDPMDPSAYSDVPRGNWSSGLEQRGNPKTGVDTTASGPLFQQRPYPSPGAILKMNKSGNKDDDDD